MSSKAGKKFKKTRRDWPASAEDIEARDADFAQREKERAARRAAAEEENGKKSTKKSANDEGGETGQAEVDDDSLGVTFSNDVQVRHIQEEEDEPVATVKGSMAALGLETANPNAKGFDREGLTSKQKKELEANRKAAAYRAAHLRGETEEAKADLKRLEEVRRRREQQRKAKLEAEQRQQKEAEEAAAKAANKGSGGGEDDIKKLDAKTIKKMNPTQIKEELKTRGLSIQGNKKELMERLIEADSK